MHTLQSVLASLRAEIGAALAAGDIPAGAIHLEPDRVVISLQVVLGAADPNAPNPAAAPPAILVQPLTPAADSAPALSGSASGHTLTIEFKVGGADLGSASATAPAVRRGPANLEEKLVQLFGPPGFDSSARAMVFCETLGDLSAEDFDAVRRVLGGEPIANHNEAVRRARHLLLGLIRSGPIKDLGRGSTFLGDLMGGQSRESLIVLVREKWKTQQDWMNG